MPETIEEVSEETFEGSGKLTELKKAKPKGWQSIVERKKSLLKCSTVMPSGQHCKLPAVRGYSHCQNHLTIEERTKRELAKRGRAIDSSDSASIEKESLVSELAILKACLSKAAKSAVKGDTLDEDKGKQIMAIIDGIRKLVESLKKIEVQNKVYSTVNKVSKVISGRCIETINKFVSDADTRQLIAAELLRVANVEAETGDLKDLLKDVQSR